MKRFGQKVLNPPRLPRVSRGDIMPDPDVIVIELWNPANEGVTCCVCGREDQNCWGLPISSETARIVANDFAGDWASKPACRDCWAQHERGAFVGMYPRC